MTSKTKAITIAVTTIALSLGSVGLATASNSKSSGKVKSSSTATIFKPSANAAPMGAFGGPEHELAGILSALVTKGTLTQAQVDAINAAIAAARTAQQTAGDSERAARETLIATTIGIDVATLEKRLDAGDTLATIAGAKTAALIAALVAAETKQIDAAVAAGKLTAAEATTLKTNLTAHITAEVNAVDGMRGMGEGRGHDGKGHHGKKDGDHGPMGSNSGGTMTAPPLTTK